MGKKKYSDDEQLAEVQVKEDIIAANAFPEKGKRPSVETSFHEAINYAFVVHMHPTMNNSLMCGYNSEAETKRLFGEEAMYIGYAPGYPLFMKVKAALEQYRMKYGHDPKIIFLENHGVFVNADNIEEIKTLYSHITTTIQGACKKDADFSELPVPEDVTEFLPYIRMKIGEKPMSAVIRHSKLHSHFYGSEAGFSKISGPFTPDIIVYCKAAYMYISDVDTPATILASFDRQLPAFISRYGYAPKIIVIKNYGVVAVEETAASAEIALEVYEDLMKVSYFSECFGGPRFLGAKEIAFIDNWEVENYRRQVSKGQGAASPVAQKVIIVTGAAQGFGEGIAENLVQQEANVVIADLNEERGKETAARLTSIAKKNKVLYMKVDVSDPASIQAVVNDTVKAFGGLDVFISNAGILHAGGIDEMDPAVFKKMTEVNYNAWFYCVKAASGVMKVQREANPLYTADLIQINSKSGLEGSNRNFAYAGAKFGGIGLTQSFALELAPFGIKVNSVCPGNFFDGPLWSDPQRGLFVQYLKAGKVPGAKTVDDVKKFYESKVPLQRGCMVDDVMKAVYYIISQQYETGQAVPVTGGQVMLN